MVPCSVWSVGGVVTRLVLSQKIAGSIPARITKPEVAQWQSDRLLTGVSGGSSPPFGAMAG